MYFWKVHMLAEELKEDTVSEKDKMLYVLGGYLVTTLLYYEALFEKVENGVWVVFEIVVICLIVMHGVFKCYDINQKAVGKRFIEKFMCLSFPLLIKFTLLSWGISYGISILIDLLVYDHYELIAKLYPFVSVTLSLMLSRLFFWRLAAYFSKAQIK